MPKIGNIPWNKGKTGYRAFGKKKGVCDNTGRTHFKKGQTPWNKGLTYKQKEGTGEKISQSLMGHKNWYIGKYTKDEAKKMRSFRETQRELAKLKRGNFSFEDWTLLKKLYKNMCLCCKLTEPEIALTQDHIIPLSKGGLNTIENIQPLCMSCNNKKFTKSISYLPSNPKDLINRRREGDLL